MSETELRAEAVKLGIEANGDVEALRRKVQAELDQRWKDENRERIEGWNRWVEKNGLPLEKYRVW